ncbi:hypothetical protein [Streptomyces sp. NPDC004658]|uniref:hypothetical protein n=1 Tax=Streptomyces sp. NPDC004658 TaxID=3154672 RepID=UPI00339E026F
MLVSVISARVGATLRTELTGAGVPQALAGKPAEAKDAVAMGATPVSRAMPERSAHRRHPHRRTLRPGRGPVGGRDDGQGDGRGE